MSGRVLLDTNIVIALFAKEASIQQQLADALADQTSSGQEEAGRGIVQTGKFVKYGGSPPLG
jgi:hypothetical protein